MGNFLRSLFGSPAPAQEENTEDKNRKRNFEILKYDGIKALRVRKPGYAVRCFREALALQDDAETLEYLAEACVEADEPGEAIDACTRLYTLDPTRPGTLLKRARLYYAGGQAEEAAADCTRLLESEDGQRDVRPYLLRARAYRQLQRTEEALADLGRATELEPDVPDTFLERAALLSELSRPAEALADADRAATLAPEEESVFLQRGRIRQALGHTQEAAEDFRRVIDLNPFNEHAYLALGELLAAGGQAAEAIALLSEATELLPAFSAAYAARARFYEATGNAEAASRDRETARATAGETEESNTVDFEKMYKNRPL